LASIRKIKAGLVNKTTINTFIGEVGNIFFDPDTGELRLSDGITPGGIPLGAGGGGGATIFRQLFDTPSTYIGSEGYFVKVKQDASGLEFVDQTVFDGDYNNLINAPDLSVYQLISNAFDGDYNNLINAPDLSLYQLISNAFDGDYNNLINAPDLFSGSYNDLTDKPTPLSVGVVDTNNNLLSNTTDVTAIRFDTDSGFDVVDLGSGIVKVQMNSTFKYWKSAGQQDLVATGLDTVEFVAGAGISISLDPNGSPYQTITLSATGGGTGGATNLNELTDVSYNEADVQIGDTLTWNGTQWVPDADSTARGLNDLFDVAYDSSVEVGDVLKWNGYEWIPGADSSAPGGGGGGDLLGVIIDLSIDDDGDLILTHVDTFTENNAFINDNGEFVLSDGL